MRISPASCRRRAASAVLASLLLVPPSGAAARELGPEGQPPVAQAPAGQPGAGQVSSAQAAQPAAPSGVPVRLDGETLFYVAKGIGPFTPEDRAAAGERRLRLIADDPFYSSGLFQIVAKANQAEIYYRSHLVGMISDQDAASTGSTTEEAAAFLVQRVDDSVARYRARRAPQAWTRAGVIMSVATLLLALLVAALRRARRQLKTLIEARHAAASPGAKRLGLGIALEQTGPLQLKALGLLYFVALSAVIALYLGLAFTTVPMTKGYALAAIDYVLEPVRTLWLGFLGSVGDVIFIVVVVVLARYLIKALRWALSEAAAGGLVIPGVSPDWAMLAFKVLRIGIVAMVAVVIYPYIPGSETEAFKGIGIFAGALFTLGASGMAGNIVGGLALTFTGTFHAGDRVKIGDVVGDVVESTLMLTRVRSIRNEVVTIPNATILGGHVVNYSTEARGRGLALVTEVTIGYDAPWRAVHDLLIEAARRTPEILAAPPSFVLQHSLNDYHVSYELWAYTANATDMFLTYGTLHQNIQDCFNEGGIEILSPGYSSLRDGNTTTIPPSYRDRSCAASPFRVEVSRATGRRELGSAEPTARTSSSSSP